MQSTKEKLKNLPPAPGCYVFKDDKGVILYVGKAKNLRNRVRSYFAKNADLSPAKQIMVQKIADIDFIRVRTEEESLLLENNLIKEHQPPYNIILKDDKFFKYIKIVNEPFPRIITARKIEPDGSEYFGPYSSAGSVNETLKLLKKIFPFRTSKQHDFVFDVLRAGEDITEAEYNAIIKQVRNILKGDIKPVLKHLEKHMQAASKNKNYERAALYRDRIAHVKKLQAYQQAIVSPSINADIINFVEFKDKLYIAILKIRKGKLLDKLQATMLQAEQDTQAALQAFVTQFYPHITNQPKELVLPINPLLTPQELETLFPRGITIKIPKRGRFKKLLELANLNADEFANTSQASFVAARDIDTALKQLQQKLKLQHRPKRIECFDISNVQGKHAVGSMVVFTNGVPDKSQYRKFSIKYTSTEKPNDFAMMAEVIARRFRHNEWPMPDLVIVDGGKGQLSSAVKTLANMQVTVPITALAKKHEELFLPLKKQAITLPKKSAGYYLIQRIRDEAHRFAITYYRLKHKKSYRNT